MLPAARHSAWGCFPGRRWAAVCSPGSTAAEFPAGSRGASDALRVVRRALPGQRSRGVVDGGGPAAEGLGLPWRSGCLGPGPRAWWLRSSGPAPPASWRPPSPPRSSVCLPRSPQRWTTSRAGPTRLGPTRLPGADRASLPAGEAEVVSDSPAPPAFAPRTWICPGCRGRSTYVGRTRPDPYGSADLVQHPCRVELEPSGQPDALQERIVVADDEQRLPLIGQRSTSWSTLVRSRLLVGSSRTTAAARGSASSNRVSGDRNRSPPVSDATVGPDGVAAEQTEPAGIAPRLESPWVTPARTLSERRAVLGQTVQAGGVADVVGGPAAGHVGRPGASGRTNPAADTPAAGHIADQCLQQPRLAASASIALLPTPLGPDQPDPLRTLHDDGPTAATSRERLRASGSRLFVGLSSSVIGELLSWSPAIATSMVSPPDSLATGRSRSSAVTPMASRTSAARASMSQSVPMMSNSSGVTSPRSTAQIASSVAVMPSRSPTVRQSRG